MDSYQLKWHSHTNHLNGSVAALYRSDKFTDVVLCTTDGCQIPAHRFVLSSCSVYLNALLECQQQQQQRGGATSALSARFASSLVYVVLPSEITTKALQVLVEYMYKGETTVSNDILDLVLQAGDLLKVRGLWRQSEASQNDETPKTVEAKQTVIKKATEVAENASLPKISVKKDEKLLKQFAAVPQINLTRQSFIGPPKLVFIKSPEGGSTLGALAPKPPPQTIIVTPDLQHHIIGEGHVKDVDETHANFVPELKIKKNDKKYAKKAKGDCDKEKTSTGVREKTTVQETSKGDVESSLLVKSEPQWEEDSEMVEQDEIFSTDIVIKPELEDMMTEAMEEEEVDEQIYSPLTCELCFEVFHIPAEWVRHIQGHAECTTQSTSRKRKTRSSSDDTEETTALLRCDLCQKHFPNPAEWVRHIQSTHTETELAISNNSAPPRRHNRYVDGDQNKTCDHCKKVFPSHASMVIHLRTHTGERPFICGLCNKGFNVKSNLLRHLRTLHDTIVGPGNVPFIQEDLIITATADSQQQQVVQPSTSTEVKVETPS